MYPQSYPQSGAALSFRVSNAQRRVIGDILNADGCEDGDNEMHYTRLNGLLRTEGTETPCSDV
jgi:hypothetical protein